MDICGGGGNIIGGLVILIFGGCAGGGIIGGGLVILIFGGCGGAGGLLRLPKTCTPNMFTRLLIVSTFSPNFLIS